jgi:hypothetical protein
MKAFFVFLFLTSSVMASDYGANIKCSYTLFGEHGGTNIRLQSLAGKWKIEYDNCTDGDQVYKVIFYQDKMMNFDFLLDKSTALIYTGARGVLKLKCVGSDIKGVYEAGGVVGLGYMYSGKIGLFTSIIGEQSICLGLEGKEEGWGIEVSPYRLEIH